MQSYRIVIEYTSSGEEPNGHSHPETWDWWELLDIGVDETLSVVSVEDIETPAGHREELMQDEVAQDTPLEEMAEIAQKYNMGY